MKTFSKISYQNAETFSYHCAASDYT